MKFVYGKASGLFGHQTPITSPYQPSDSFYLFGTEKPSRSVMLPRHYSHALQNIDDSIMSAI
eukprot:scaffold257080_cov23-Prasinocladus_malaysianus.AAC.1